MFLSQVIKECSAMNVPVIVAPYEADAQITYLVKSGVVDFAITEDSDLLPFGCQVRVGEYTLLSFPCFSIFMTLNYIL